MLLIVSTYLFLNRHSRLPHFQILWQLHVSEAPKSHRSRDCAVVSFKSLNWRRLRRGIAAPLGTYLIIYVFIWFYWILCGFIFVYSNLYVFIKFHMCFGCLDLYFNCLDLHFGCLGFYLDVWTCIWVPGLVFGCLRQTSKKTASVKKHTI